MISPDGRLNRIRSFGHDSNPFSSPDNYYATESASARHEPRNRTFSAVVDGTDDALHSEILAFRNNHRRLSIDAPGSNLQKISLPVEQTLKELLSQEDTDSNIQITIDDKGPKVIKVGTARSEGYRSIDLRGTYVLSNLLQELILAKDYGRTHIILDVARLNENPVDRLNRIIKDFFWPNLTRCIDGQNIDMVAKDPKDWTDDPRPRIYVPRRCPDQYEYYSNLARDHPKMRLDVQWLAKDITAEYIRDLNDAPGLLALPLEQGPVDENGRSKLQGKPFVVPGGRFNEIYGWDSYMIALGLLQHDRVDLCKSMVENFTFCVEHYGKILNANRSYYLGRSQPPFLTDMCLRVYDRIQHEPGAKEFLRNGILAAMKEYYGVWMSAPRLDENTGLSRYRPIGIGVPPETEATHFLTLLEPYAKKYGMSFKDFVQAYNHGEIKVPELDTYFLHDRAVRESGHDTSYRLERLAADLATVDLNSCLYKIECDIARVIRNVFNDHLVVPAEFQVGQATAEAVETSAIWERRAKKRRVAMEYYMWDETKGLYFDYDTAKEEVTQYESATAFWAMWAGVATPRQAARMVLFGLDKLEELGGLASGTKTSRGEVGLKRPNRQWDYPFGWAPHQILAWTGLQRYGYQEDAQRLAYKWAYMVTKAFVDFNGVVVEKYNVCNPERPHEVAAEYGNQGADFKGVPREGFGWVNASYALALDVVNIHMKRALGTLTPWEVYQSSNREADIFNLPAKNLHPQRAATGLNHDDPNIIKIGKAYDTKGLGHLPASHASHAHHAAGNTEATTEAMAQEKHVSLSTTKPSPSHPTGSELERQKSAHSEFAHELAMLRAEKAELDHPTRHGKEVDKFQSSQIDRHVSEAP